MPQTETHPELTEIFRRLASGEANWKERLKAIKFALTGTFIPSNEKKEQKTYWEFVADYDRESQPSIDYKFFIDDENFKIIGTCELNVNSSMGLRLSINGVDGKQDASSVDSREIFFVPDEQHAEALMKKKTKASEILNFESFKAGIDVLETDKFKVSIKFENVVLADNDEGTNFDKKLQSFSAKVVIHKKF